MGMCSGWSEDSMLRSAVELAEEGMMISDQVRRGDVARAEVGRKKEEAAVMLLSS